MLHFYKTFYIFDFSHTIWYFKITDQKNKEAPDMGKKERIFTKWDILILLFLIFVGVIFSVWIFRPDSSPGNYLEIRQNGEVLKTLPLNRDARETISGKGGGLNTFIIQDGSVSMIEADCGDHTCIQTGSIQKNGESIVCLPHRLVLQIVASDKGNGDAKTQPDGIVH